jgi:sialidase-1
MRTLSSRTTPSLVLALIAATQAWAAEPSLATTELYTRGQGDYLLYRIPGIVVTAKGAVLAYCEGRKNDRGDWNTIDILLRRSTDGGKTFSPPRKIADVAGPHVKNPVALAQKLAGPDDVTYNNPVAIADRTGPVHFVFGYEYMRAFHMRSDDDGLTFSRPVEITAAFEPFRSDYDWKVIATGPGHGIQLRNGRLLIPVWLSPGTGGHAHRPSVTSTIYSDNRGKTWKRGAIAVPDSREFAIPNETVAEQLADGRVLLNVRSESAAHRRIQVTSPDGAAKWSKPRFVPELVEPICFGSLVRLSLAKGGGRNRLLFSNPDTLDPVSGAARPGQRRERKNLTIHMSYDEGETWPVKKVLEPGSSGYSDLAVLQDGTILCLYETKTAMFLARFNLEWLTGGKDSLKRR